MELLIRIELEHAGRTAKDEHRPGRCLEVAPMRVAVGERAAAPGRDHRVPGLFGVGAGMPAPALVASDVAAAEADPERAFHAALLAGLGTRSGEPVDVAEVLALVARMNEGQPVAFELGLLARRHGARRGRAAQHLADGSGDSVRMALRHEVLAAGVRCRDRLRVGVPERPHLPDEAGNDMTPELGRVRSRERG